MCNCACRTAASRGWRKRTACSPTASATRSTCSCSARANDPPPDLDRPPRPLRAGGGSAPPALPLPQRRDRPAAARRGRMTLLPTLTDLHGRFARVAEAHRLLSHCLSDAIALQLLGAGE